MSSDQPQPEPDRGRLFLGGLFMVVGGIWAGLCGACTLAFAGTGIWAVVTARGSSNDGASIVGMALFVGFIFTAPGVAVFFLGRSIRRSARL